jgi:hypothetical protein
MGVKFPAVPMNAKMLGQGGAGRVRQANLEYVPYFVLVFLSSLTREKYIIVLRFCIYDYAYLKAWNVYLIVKDHLRTGPRLSYLDLCIEPKSNSVEILLILLSLHSVDSSSKKTTSRAEARQHRRCWHP